MNESNTAKKLTGGIVAVIILVICLTVTTFALVWTSVSVENNLFQTGKVEINLNDGRPIIHESEFIFEPGMTVKKDFFLKNESAVSVYYRLYFESTSGGLADVLEITVSDGDRTLYKGTANELNNASVGAADDVLQIGEKRSLTVEFHFPKDKGNEAQGLDLAFTMCAEGTQCRNNPNKEFR